MDELKTPANSDWKWEKAVTECAVSACRHSYACNPIPFFKAFFNLIFLNHPIIRPPTRPPARRALIID